MATADNSLPFSGKTVFIVDREKYIAQVSSHHSVIGDCIKDQQKANYNKNSNLPKIQPFKKSLWTCSIEAVVEYSRLIWDLFPGGERPIAIISSSTISGEPAPCANTEIICDWTDGQQNLTSLMRSLARSKHQAHIPITPLEHTIDISKYPNSDGKNLKEALDKGFDLLSEITPAQRKRASSRDGQVNNQGRLILVSSFKDDASIERLVGCAKQLLESKCESLSASSSQTPSSPAARAPISQCELLIINTFPLDDQGPTSQLQEIKEPKEVTPRLRYVVSSVKSGRSLAGVLSNYCLQHYNLRSTTITGIPMKEEQNASSSSNYDVEIMHCSSAHDDLTKSGNPIFEGVVNVKYRHGFPYKSYTLRWCTPRSNNVELYHCIASSRITSVDVNSRPSSCLTNFLLNGRAVMLEIYKSKSSRMTSHMLASHNGELYIHTLSTANHKLNFDDPPSILDGIGGKTHDYRFDDFNDFIKRNTLVPSKVIEGAKKEPIYPLHRALNPIKKQTLYWPLTNGHTILFNIQTQMAKLLSAVPKDSLIMEDVIECKKNIYEVVKMENEGSPLPSPTITSLLKLPPTGASRSNQTRLNQLYRLLWNELEYFLRINSTTPEHEAILECLMECRASDKQKQVVDKTKGAKRSNKATKNSDHNQDEGEPSSKKLKNQLNQLIPKSIESVSPELLAHYRSGLTLMQTWASLYGLAHRNKSRPQFHGRLEGNIHKLYSHLDIDVNMGQERDFDSNNLRHQNR